MRFGILALTGLLMGAGLLAFVGPAHAAPSCGAPDEHLNLVDTDVWYGGGGCYGVVVLWLPPEFCPVPNPILDRPYAYAAVFACGAAVLLQP